MKRGMELPQSVIVIAIIVLVVLVVILAFFVGGFGKLGERLSGLFAGGVDDQATAVSFCENYCDSAKGFLDNAAAVSTSAYCTKSFKLDRDNDGKVDKNKDTGRTTKYFCSGNNHKVDNDADPEQRGVGVECPEVTCGR
ncbi:hypothetical protein J4440_06015 [Candidatus Woesearchaeota archaeon]|nr:hypothetical protein [Candidatus Woesearchaeota archaeon]